MVPRPRVGDVALSGALCIASLVEAVVVHDANGSPGLLTVVSVLTTASLIWRRSTPTVAVVGSMVGVLLPVALDTQADDPALLVANLVAMHAANAYGSPRVAVAGTAALLTSVMASIALSSPRTPGDLQWALLLFGLAAGAGQLMSRQARATRAAVLAAEREAVAQERRSVAADLHDVIAHGLALMVVQAGAAATVMDSDPRRARDLLDGVQEAGERAAAELHHLLTVLAPDGTPAPPGPTPGLTELGALTRAASPGGAVLDLEVIGDPSRVPPGLSHACYRIVQEAWTNAIKHAPGSAVSATVVIADGQVDLRVENTRGHLVTRLAVLSGHGLAAMRERVALFGGSLDCGPTPHGWRTSATFPLVQEGVEGL